MRRPRPLIGTVAILAAAVGLIGAAPDSGTAVALQGSADLAITWSKTPGVTTIPGGATVRYVITVKNGGPDPALGVTLDIGMVTEKAKIVSGAVSDGARCTKEDVISGLAFLVHCPIGTLSPGASKSATLQLNALPRAGKTGGAILVAAMTTASADTSDPDDSNSLLLFQPGDDIQYSIVGRLGGGKSTAHKIRARVLIAPYGSQSQTVVRYRRLNVFKAPPAARVTLRGSGVVEIGTTNGAGKLQSRKFVNRSLAVGSIFSVRVTKPGRIGDLLRIKVIAGGAALARRQCIPLGGGAPRASCK